MKDTPLIVGWSRKLYTKCNIEDIPQSVKSNKEVVHLGVIFSADGRMEGEVV